MARVHFHEELEALELDVLGMGELVERAVGRSVTALVHHDDGVPAVQLASPRLVHPSRPSVAVIAVRKS